jgi:hypothetical protein
MAIHNTAGPQNVCSNMTVDEATSVMILFLLFLFQIRTTWLTLYCYMDPVSMP